MAVYVCYRYGINSEKSQTAEKKYYVLLAILLASVSATAVHIFIF